MVTNIREADEFRPEEKEQINAAAHYRTAAQSVATAERDRHEADKRVLAGRSTAEQLKTKLLQLHERGFASEFSEPDGFKRTDEGAERETTPQEHAYHEGAQDGWNAAVLYFATRPML